MEVDAQKKSVASAEEKLREQQAKGGAGAPAAEAKVAVEKDKESSEWRGGGEEGRGGGRAEEKLCEQQAKGGVRVAAVVVWRGTIP